MRTNIATLALVTLCLVLFVWFTRDLPWTAWRIAGAAVAIPAFLLFAVARVQLGSAFSAQAKATTLVTSGIYSRIRNPIYVFGGLFIAGCMIWAHRPWLLLVFVVLLPLQIYRSGKEEQVLREKFGEAYDAYKQKTWF
ncbi:MAG: isoprenylcysteine carboxylmethyltransferase family protein [Acidobacteriaceae bacterium]